MEFKINEKKYFNLLCLERFYNLYANSNSYFSSALWDCTECKSDLSSLLEGYASEESSNEIVGVLQNDFCPNPDLDLGGEDNIEDCQNFMPLFIPDAMKQISQMVAEHSPVLCQNLFDVPCRVEGAGEPRG